MRETFISFDISDISKTKSLSIGSKYTMHVIPDSSGYKTKFRLEDRNFHKNGYDYGGELHRTDDWYESDDLGLRILDYYFTHQSTIRTFSDQIDVSRWKPLFALSVNEGNQQHVLRLTKREDAGECFWLDCEMLGFNNVLVNGELESYYISTSTLYFIPHRGRYLVKIKYLTAKAYTNGEKDVTDLTIPDREEETRYADEVWFSKKVLEYYFAHKSEIEITKDEQC